MSTGLMATIGVLVLVGIFGLIILLDRKKNPTRRGWPQEGCGRLHDSHRKMGRTRGAVAETRILGTVFISYDVMMLTAHQSGGLFWFSLPATDP